MDTTRLRARLMALIEREFGALGDKRVAEALTELAHTFEERAKGVAVRHASSASEPSQVTDLPSSALARADDAPSWSQSHLPPEVSAAGASAMFAGASNAPELTVVAEDEERVANLLHQIVEIGALLVELEERMSFNEMVRVTIVYQPLEFSIHVVGRVVNISRRGTAIEVIQLSREDRAAMERLYADYQSRQIGSEASDAAPMAHKGPPEASGSRRTDREISKPIPRLGTTLEAPRFVVRRQVSITTPDDELVASTTQAQAIGVVSSELFGPTLGWCEYKGDPERIEELEGDRIVDILLQLSEHDFTGALELKLEDSTGSARTVTHQILFDGGFLVDVTSRPRIARFELATMLLMAKRADDTQISIAAAHADEHSLTMARSLLELDLMTPEQLRHAIAGRLTFLLRDFSALRAGTVRTFNQEQMPAGFLPTPPLRVHVPAERTIFQMLFEQLKGLSAKERELASRGELDAYPEVQAEERERLERTLSDPTHLKLFERVVNGRRRLREVFTESALPSADTFAIVFALHRMGVLVFDRSLHHTVVRERFRENVTVKYLSVHKASYFEVLNVHWSSYDDVIAKAYDDLTEQFDPNTVPENMEEEVHQRVREIRDRVESAFQVLAEREHRHSYRMRIMPEYKLAHAIPLFLKQCELAERRQEWSGAIDSLRRVLEIEPDHPEANTRMSALAKRTEGGLDDESSATM
ncbi:MAG: hypothetical protein AAGI01_09025 [Myxococcota bacterium]